LVRRGHAVLLDPLAHFRDEHRWNGLAPRTSLGLTWLVERDVGFGDVETTPAFGRQLDGSNDAKHCGTSGSELAHQRLSRNLDSMPTALSDAPADVKPDVSSLMSYLHAICTTAIERRPDRQRNEL